MLHIGALGFPSFTNSLCNFTSLIDGHFERDMSIIKQLPHWKRSRPLIPANTSTRSSPVHHRAQLLPDAVTYITVSFSNYPVAAELINEPLMRLIRVVNWLGPSTLIPP